MSTVFTLKLPTEEFDKKEILRYCGTKISNEQIDALLEDCLKEIEGKISNCVCYCEFDICQSSAELDLGFCKTNSQLLKNHLKGCKKIVLFAATIGAEIDRLIIKYSKLSPAKAVIFQGIGTERIEALCDAFENKLKTERGDTVSRVSAGYGDIPLSMQNDIFRVLDCSKKIGVTLNGNLLMSPTKSVTAIIGVKQYEH